MPVIVGHWLNKSLAFCGAATYLATIRIGCPAMMLSLQHNLGACLPAGPFPSQTYLEPRRVAFRHTVALS